jgi:Ca2+-transporting ATPase
MSKEVFTVTVEAAVSQLATNLESGLSVTEASNRLLQNGPNALVEPPSKAWIFKILAQFKDFLVIILIIAAVISIVVGDDLIDGMIILAILIVNMIISLVQENKADNALKELKNMSAPKVKVLRQGDIKQMDSAELVVGDVVILDAGDYVPADLRITESINLRIDEAALTGESVPTEKHAEVVLDSDTPLGDRKNSAFMGTVVNYGRGKGIVSATGMATEMGKIATILNTVEEQQTPLQIKLDKMAKKLGIILVIACAVIFGIGFLYDMDLMEIFMVSVSLAVAAVPEGVAIVTTMILAMGVHRMVKSNVIVKRMSAVETLGSTTVICSDKTGTLTQNKMTVVNVFDTDHVYEVTGTGYQATGEVVADVPLTKNIAKMAEIAALCNDALYDVNESKVIGDPTEAAMLVFCEKSGLGHKAYQEAHERLREIPFDSDRKLMSTYNVVNNQIVMNTKGAPDEIIRRATKIYHGGEILQMSETMRTKLLEQNEQFAKAAFRVLGFAFKEYASESDIDEVEQELIYVGMMCMIDPPREEAKDAIAACHHAGINVKMITGDHKITASVIGKQLGIIKDMGAALEGLEINGLSDEQLREKVKTVNVFARVSPEHKVRIVKAIQANDNIVAMTGDGVNDAPSLKQADIGIAMGITGTDVSKEASDIILTDDNFVSIVNAIEQGRTIYNNIRKVIGYLLSANIGEIMIMLLAIVFRFPVPLVATQLLFVNLLTDALPAFALGMEEKEAGIMAKKPRDPQESIINKVMRNMIIYKCIFLAFAVLGSFYYGWKTYGEATGITFAFFTLVSSELLVTYSARTETFLGFKKATFSNHFLNRSILVSFVILLVTIYVPALRYMFSTEALTMWQLLIAFLFSLIPILGSEMSKLLGSSRK